MGGHLGLPARALHRAGRPAVVALRASAPGRGWVGGEFAGAVVVVGLSWWLESAPCPCRPPGGSSPPLSRLGEVLQLLALCKGAVELQDLRPETSVATPVRRKGSNPLPGGGPG